MLQRSSSFILQALVSEWESFLFFFSVYQFAPVSQSHTGRKLIVKEAEWPTSSPTLATTALLEASQFHTTYWLQDGLASVVCSQWESRSVLKDVSMHAETARLSNATRQRTVFMESESLIATVARWRPQCCSSTGAACGSQHILRSEAWRSLRRIVKNKKILQVLNCCSNTFCLIFVQFNCHSKVTVWLMSVDARLLTSSYICDKLSQSSYLQYVLWTSML